MDKISKYFGFVESGTDYRTETIAGITTFMTMAYIIFVNPTILASPFGAKMPFEAVLAATCISTAATTVLMAFLANYPIALAPGMGLNAFFSFIICGAMKVPWQTALGMVFISGLLFLALSLVGFREKLIDAIPDTLKYATACGIGAFIAFIGLKDAGIVVASPATLVTFGKLNSTPTLIALTGLLLTAALIAKGVRGSILLGLIATATIGAFSGLIKFIPQQASQGGTFLQLDILGAINFWEHPEYIAPIFILLFFDLFDTVGTLIGVGEQAGFMVNGVLPRARQAMATDAIGTSLGALLGTSTVTSYIESASGVSEGGRTGFANLVTAALFMSALGLFYLAKGIGLGTLAQNGMELLPITAPALIVVGTLMMTNISKIEWQDFSEALPAFLVIMLMPLTFSISAGITAGFISYPILKIVRGKAKEVHPLLYAIAIIIIIGYIVI